MGVGAERKAEYFKRLTNLFDTYSSTLVISCDNVGSSHLQSIRKALRILNGVMIFGKNTLVKKAIKSHLEVNPKLEAVLPFIKGNVGFIFCMQASLPAIVKLCKDLRVSAAAKAGMVAPQAVVVPAGPTGMEPTQTGFLQALNIPSKINKGQIEIIKDVQLLNKGQRVGNSEAALLSRLSIRPFEYGLIIEVVYDNGATFDPSLLDVTDNIIYSAIGNALRNVAAVSLATGIPTLASVPHSLLKGYQNVLAVGLGSGYTYPAIADLKERIANPSKFVAAAPAPAAVPAAKEETKDAAKDDKKAKKEAKKESDDGDMGFGLFD